MLFCCDIRALLDCDILTGFKGLKTVCIIAKDLASSKNRTEYPSYCTFDIVSFYQSK